MWPFVISFFSFFMSDTTGQVVPQSIYEFKVEGLQGDTIDFAAFKGKHILIVNTASRCGLTPQYEGLEKLYKEYKDCLVIVGFPANNFLDQEPGTNEEIAQFCKDHYGVTFPMAAKISVKGKQMAPIYLWLTKKIHNGYQDSAVSWNFQKYLIDKEGNLIKIYPPKTNPEKVIADLDCNNLE
jgi:glutathione peroxidase